MARELRSSRIGTLAAIFSERLAALLAGRQVPLAAGPTELLAWASIFLPQLGQGPIQRLPVDELHRIVVDSPLDADGKDGNDIGMVELRGGLGLVFEAGDLPAVEDCRERQDLQGHAPAQRDLLAS